MGAFHPLAIPCVACFPVFPSRSMVPSSIISTEVIWIFKLPAYFRNVSCLRQFDEKVIYTIHRNSLKILPNPGEIRNPKSVSVEGLEYESLVFQPVVLEDLPFLLVRFTYNWIKDLSLPSYDDKGELTDGGYDLKSSGLCSYLHDVLYVTAFVQYGSLISDKAWYIFLVIPAFALYKLWTMILYPYFFLSQKAVPEDEVSRKKKEKAERKASRPKFAKARR